MIKSNITFYQMTFKCFLMKQYLKFFTQDLVVSYIKNLFVVDL